jgi:N-methylhydantoinase A/oxoprolinase/acetone carboxylase beta subunit
MRKIHPVAIGIDTGGTNTDAAVLDIVTRRVLACAKAPTTYYDYSVGIAGALQALPAGLVRRAVRVGVSTTLATNAISTGSGEPAGLILLGYPALAEQQALFEPRAGVSGAMSILGEPLEPLDEAGLVAAARRLVRDHAVTAIAVSGFCAIMNPLHEQRAAEILQEEIGVPIVQAHHLSMRLGAADRAVTAGWNARLLGNIARLLAAVERTCRRMDLNVPIVVIRADGTAMPAEAARLRPVETILSGPAASIEGGLALAGTKRAVVVDVGGTTTDIGLAVGGAPAVRDEVAVVGGHTLAVRAVQEYTVALGGDSYIQITGDGLRIGPARVVPVSVLARREPGLVAQLAALADGEDDSLLYQPTDIFALAGPIKQIVRADHPAVAALASGPLTRPQLARALGLPHPSLVSLQNLPPGSVVLSALTPTDCLVALGRTGLGDKAAADLAVARYARRAGTSSEAFVESVLTRFTETLSLAILQARLVAGGVRGDLLFQNPDLNGLVRAALARDSHLPIEMKLKLKEPIAAVGAPASAYIPSAGRRLGTRTIVPKAAGVAAAVGAALAGLAIRSTATICPTPSMRFSVHGELGRYEFDTLEEAKTFLETHLSDLLRERAGQMGLCAADIAVRFTDRTAEVMSEEGVAPLWLESRVLAEASQGITHPSAC